MRASPGHSNMDKRSSHWASAPAQDPANDHLPPQTNAVEVVAQEMIDFHGHDQATIEAAHYVRACASSGDQDACQRWLLVLDAIRNWYDGQRRGMIAG